MFRWFINFFRTGPDAPRLQLPAERIKKMYETRRWKVFAGITLGYIVLYINKLGWSVVKKPVVDSGLLNIEQTGKIGAILLFTYGFGKFFNGILGDYTNIRKFFSAGLLCTSLINLAFGFTSVFWLFFLLWAFNGWFQSTGPGPCVVTMSQWFSKKERGTMYGLWSSAHAFGELLVMAGLTLVAAHFLKTSPTDGWRAAFYTAGIAGIIMATFLIFLLSDRPETYGLPNIKEYKNEPVEEASGQSLSIIQQQIQIMKYPAMWAVGMASFFNYITRYGINSYGVIFLQEARHYDLKAAGLTIAVNTVPGAIGAALCGLISDRFFKSDRNKPMLLYGLIQIVALIGFFYLPKEYTVLSVVCLGVYGFAMGGTLAYLGGMIAIDLVPRKVAGAAMGFIGLISYMGASAQDWISGHMLQKTTVTLASGEVSHNYDKVILFWVGSTVLSVLLSLTVWKAKVCQD